MRTGNLVFALTAAGVVGGVVGALLMGSGDAPPAAGNPGPRVEAPSAAKAPLSRGDLDALRNRVEALEANLGAAQEETGRLRNDLAEARKAGEAAAGRLEALESSASAGGGDRPTGQVGSFNLGNGEEIQLLRARAMELAGSAGSAERFRKMRELRKLTEEERWAKTREALGLTPYQEDELKGALKERGEALREAMKTTEVSTGGDGSTAIAIAMPDPEKMREARRTYDDRVANALNTEQAKKWRDEGYESAMGGGGLVSTSIRVE